MVAIERIVNNDKLVGVRVFDTKCLVSNKLYNETTSFETKDIKIDDASGFKRNLSNLIRKIRN